jgi:hypothetical protein
MLKARIDGAQPVPREASLFSRRIPIGWAVAAQAASLAVVIAILAFAPVRPQLLYRTLGSPPAPASGNQIVVFRPEVSEATLRAILTQNQARIVDGPTSTDAYVLRVDPERHATVLARLKSDRVNVSLAEPLDGSDR